MSGQFLVIQGARFGDLVQTGRLIASLAQGGGEIHLAVDKSLVPLARLLYPDAHAHGIGFHGPGDSLAESRKALAELRGLDFAAIYNCNFSRLTASLCRMFEAGRVIGYRPARGSIGGILRSAWCRMGFRLGARRCTTPLNLADFWAWFHDMPISPAFVNPPARGGGRGIGIALAGRDDRRSLPTEALAQAAQTVFHIKGAKSILLFGTAAEVPRARKLMRLFTPSMLEKTADLCGKTDWGALCAEMAGLDLLLTPDTGLMHLAARLGVPVLAFFLSSAWCHETGPYGEGHAILQAAPACAPCLESAACANAAICRNVYESSQFGRAVAYALDAGPATGAWPDDFQLWRSGLDDLGALPHLEAGSDKFAQMRRGIRIFIKSYLGLGAAMPNNGAARELLPASEWMLPPWRYC